MPDALVLDHRSTLDDLAGSIVATAARLAAATCDWLLLVADFDSREGSHRYGLPTTAHWLAHTCSLAQRTAEEHVRVARALAVHPRLAAEMRAGRLSYSHIRAISRAARPGEDELVDELVNVAEHGTVSQLEAMVRGLRTVRDIAGGDDPPKEYVTHGWTPRGQHRTSARLDPERGAVVDAAIDAIARAENLTRPDALVRLAEIGLATIKDAGAPAAGGERRVARALRGDEEAAVVVHVDASAPHPDRSAERPRGRVARGPGLPDEVVERLLCVGRIRTVVRDGPDPRSNVLDLGRSRRLVTKRQFLALLLRDGGCAYPGCRSRHGLEAHHVVHWIRGGRTDLANLVVLCRRHHHAHHDGEFGIEAGTPTGRFRFFRGDGVELPERVDPSEYIRAGSPPIVDGHEAVEADAATTRWGGERMEREYAVSCLADLLHTG